jgi:hypothetical protein
MDLTNEIIEQNGFERVNNSTWRLDYITIQNWHTCEGKSVVERILNTKKAYKVNCFGQYLRMITDTKELEEILQTYRASEI